MKSIFSYKSYREFLKEGFLREKASSKKTTLAEYAKRFNVSASALTMIFSGTRNLTIENLHCFARTLRLSQPEYEYFEALVLRDQANEDPRARAYYNRRLKEIATSAPVQHLRLSTRFLLQEWYVPALLIYLIDFELKEHQSLAEVDRASVAQKFGLPLDVLNRLFDQFLTSHLFDLDASSPVHLMFERLTSQGSQKNYIKAVHKELERRLEADFENPESIHRAFVFSTRRDLLQELRSELTAIFEKYMTLADNNPKNNVLLQTLLGTFPI